MKRLQQIVGFLLISIFVVWVLSVLLSSQSAKYPEPITLGEEIPDRQPQKQEKQSQNTKERSVFDLGSLLVGRFNHPFNLAVDTLNDLLTKNEIQDTAFLEFGKDWEFQPDEKPGVFLIGFQKGRLLDPMRKHIVGYALLQDSIYLSVWRQDTAGIRQILKYVGTYYPTWVYSKGVSFDDLNGDQTPDLLLDLGWYGGSRVFVNKRAFVYKPNIDSFIHIKAIDEFTYPYFDPKRKLVFNFGDGGNFYRTDEMYGWDSQNQLKPIKSWSFEDDRKGKKTYILSWFDGFNWHESIKRTNPSKLQLQTMKNRFDSLYFNEVFGDWIEYSNRETSNR